jgi:hypothetical protein
VAGYIDMTLPDPKQSGAIGPSCGSANHFAANDASWNSGGAPKMAGEAPALPITSRYLRTDYHAFPSLGAQEDLLGRPLHLVESAACLLSRPSWL